MSIPAETLRLHKMVKEQYLSLTKGKECQVTYVWIKDDRDLRSKTRTLYHKPAGIRDIPEWNIASDDVSEPTMVPVRMFRDPFTLDPNKLVLCKLLNVKNVSTGSDPRSQCVTAMDEAKQFQPWFGMKQEYMLLGLNGKPLGTNAVGGRDISMCHNRACLYAGVKVFGGDTENLYSQWEFQVGTYEGVEMGDDLWMARYILHRVCEDFGVVASLDPKPIKEISNSSGCHINFSTEEMRSEGGLRYIEEAISKLGKRHSQHLSVYDPRGGADNKRRLTSQGCASSFHHFSTAVACRNVSVRIPGHVSRKGCGYFEDRRPAANCDPYLVMRAMVETCLLGATEEEEEEAITS